MDLATLTAVIDEVRTNPAGPVAALDAHIAAAEQSTAYLRALRQLVAGDGIAGIPPKRVALAAAKEAGPPGKALPGPASRPRPGSSKIGRARRLAIARRILEFGPIKTCEAESVAECNRGSIYYCLGSAWFANENQKWTLTPYGREQVKLADGSMPTSSSSSNSSGPNTERP